VLERFKGVSSVWYLRTESAPSSKEAAASEGAVGAAAAVGTEPAVAGKRDLTVGVGK